MAVLSSTARAAIISEAKSKFGPNFPDTLLSIYIDAYIDTGNDATEAGNVMRQSTEYAQAFPGNLNPDGVSVKYTESEYLQIVDSYKRKIESLGVNSDLIVTTEKDWVKTQEHEPEFDVAVVSILMEPIEKDKFNRLLKSFSI